MANSGWPGRMNRCPPRYPKECRNDVIRIALDRGPKVPPTQIAKGFGIHVGTHTARTRSTTLTLKTPNSDTDPSPTKRRLLMRQYATGPHDGSAQTRASAQCSGRRIHEGRAESVAHLCMTTRYNESLQQLRRTIYGFRTLPSIGLVKANSICVRRKTCG